MDNISFVTNFILLLFFLYKYIIIHIVIHNINNVHIFL